MDLPSVSHSNQQEEVSSDKPLKAWAAKHQAAGAEVTQEEPNPLLADSLQSRVSHQVPRRISEAVAELGSA